jgi:ornithine--oxo-acid transaminase
MAVLLRDCAGEHPTDFGAFAGTIFVSFVPLIIMLIFQRYFTSSIAVSDNVGHNHPFVVAELVSELQSQSPTMLQSNVVMEAGALARTLCENAGGKVSKVFFCSSGSEGVEAVIKFARAHTGRTDLVYAAGAFHGLTSGALSLMGSDFWRESFGPMLGGTHEVSFGDLVAIEKLLLTKTIAAVILEPIQAEAGIVLPLAGYLSGVQRLCQRYGTLFILDEVQTGMGRTGTFLAGQRYEVEPDMIVMVRPLAEDLSHAPLF